MKLYLTSRALACRAAYPDLFARGEYIPLAAEGAAADHVVAFARRDAENEFIMAVPRLVVGLTRKELVDPIGPEVWGDTRLLLPDAEPGTRYRDVFSGETIKVVGSDDGVSLGPGGGLRRFSLRAAGTYRLNSFRRRHSRGWFFYLGAGVLPMMENSEHDDFIRSGLVVVDDVLLYLDAAASGKEIVPWPTGLWVLGRASQEPESIAVSIGCLLLGSPGALRVQQDVFQVPLGLTGVRRMASLRADIGIWFLAAEEPFLGSSGRCPPPAPA